MYEQTSEQIGDTIHKASRAAASAAEVIEDGVGAAKRAVKQGGYAAAELYCDAKRRVQRNPVEAVVATFAAGIAAGAAIKLDADEGVTHGLAVGEGVETCLSARQLEIRPVWALGSTSNIATFPVLSGVACLTILGENDAASAKAFHACGARWHTAGREVLINRPTVGKDLNDAIRGAAWVLSCTAPSVRIRERSSLFFINI